MVNSSRGDTHKNLEISARIALSLPNILGNFVQEANESISVLILSASRAHVASDDAFEVDFGPFLEKFYPVTLSLEKTKIFQSFNFPTLYNTVTTHLTFLEIVLLTENTSVKSTKIIVDHFRSFPTLLPVLIGLRNQQVAELSCRVYRLLLGKLDTLLPESSSEVGKIQTTLTLRTRVF